MRTLLVIALCLLCLGVRGQLNYANTNSGAILAALPTVLYNADRSTTVNPTPAMLLQAGWLTVGYVQPPSNGWSMLGNYSIIPASSNGYCSLMITGQYNIQIASDTALTNSVNWLTLSNDMEIYSNLTWKYSPAHYTASLTNFANTPAFTMDYYTDLCRTSSPAITVSNTVDFMTAISKLTELIVYFGASTNPPWRLIK